MDSFEYQSSTTVCCKDIGIRLFEFVAITQFLCIEILFLKAKRNAWKWK